MAQFDKFTERARKVLQLAQDEAIRFNHHYIGTEHLLLGLVREGDGVAARVLDNMGVRLPRVRSAVEFIIGRGEGEVEGEIRLTPRAKTVLELAIDEGRRLDHHYIGTEHLLLGLVREGEGIAAGVLESLGVNLEKVRTQVQLVIALSYPSRGVSEFLSPRDSSGRVSRQLILKAAMREFLEPQVSGLERTDAEVLAVHKVIRSHPISDQAWPHASVLATSSQDTADPERLSVNVLQSLLSGTSNAAALLLGSHAVNLDRVLKVIREMPESEPSSSTDMKKAAASLLHRSVLETMSTGLPILGTTHLLSAMVYRPNDIETSMFRVLEADLFRMRIELEWIHTSVELQLRAVT